MTNPKLLLLPDMSDPESAPFWNAVRDHRFKMQKCSACGHVRWPPAPICPSCLHRGGADDWTEISDEGQVWSFVVYHRALDARFAEKIPYNVAYIKLDAGPLLVSNVVGTNDLKIGQRVKVCYDDITADATLVRFKLL